VPASRLIKFSSAADPTGAESNIGLDTYTTKDSSSKLLQQQKKTERQQKRLK